MQVVKVLNDIPILTVEQSLISLSIIFGAWIDSNKIKDNCSGEAFCHEIPAFRVAGIPGYG